MDWDTPWNQWTAAHVVYPHPHSQPHAAAPAHPAANRR
jgi:hypothetical protein